MLLADRTCRPFKVPRSLGGNRQSQRRHGCCLHRPQIVAMGAADPEKLDVLVTGAAGRTGKLILEKLLEHNFFSGFGLVHSKQVDFFRRSMSLPPILEGRLQSLEKLKDINAPANRMYVADITKGLTPELEEAFKSKDAVIICTSAVPKMKTPPSEGKPPEFEYPEGQYPEQVDWIGQKAQIDAAKKGKVNQVVIVSSMGGTDENNRLNALGNGKILIHKRRAEKYLIDQDFSSYFILHPGGLVDEQGGEREIVLGANDELMQETSRSIPRADVAELCIQALEQQEAQNRSLDAITRQPGKGETTTDFGKLFSDFKGNCKYDN